MGFLSPAVVARMTPLAPLEVPMLPLAAMASPTAQDAPFHPEIRSRDSSQTPPPVASGQQLSSINEAESLVDLSALLIDDEKTAHHIGRSASACSGPVPPLAESEVEESDAASVSTRASSFYYDDGEDSESTTSNRSTAAISKRPLPVRTLSPSPPPPPPLSSISKRPLPTKAVPPRLPLQWEFSGLTIWIELEEFDSDLSSCIAYMSRKHGVELIPRSHMTAIYGMDHLGAEEARHRLRTRVREALPGGRWPKFRPPIGIVQDVAVAGNPGQVCSIAWAQLTLASGPDHEIALDALYDVFYGGSSSSSSSSSSEPELATRKKAERHRPWTPHNSFAYDNPEGTVLTTAGAFEAVAQHPTLLTEERDVAAISLWDTNGKMGDWRCLERITF